MKAIEKDMEQGRAVIRVVGSFDASLAWRLREELRSFAEVEVVLDFGSVRELSELALAVLANGIASRRARVLFRGLSLRHQRLLQYCGLAIGGERPLGTHP